QSRRPARRAAHSRSSPSSFAAPRAADGCGRRAGATVRRARSQTTSWNHSSRLPPMPVTWTSGATFEDVRYELSGDGIAKITIDRPEVRNAFRPQTVVELSEAFELAREDPDVGVVILTGEGELAFCSGGDQRVRGDQGYESEPGSGVGRFHVTDLH